MNKKGFMELPSFYSALQINLLYLSVSFIVWGTFVFISQKKISIPFFLLIVCFTSGALTWIHFYISFMEATTYSPGFKSINKFIGNLTSKVSVAIYLVLLALYYFIIWVRSFRK